MWVVREREVILFIKNGKQFWPSSVVPQLYKTEQYHTEPNMDVWFSSICTFVCMYIRMYCMCVSMFLVYSLGIWLLFH